jgi:dTDP-4-amino-4,6-dideoxygalactose transaminase
MEKTISLISPLLPPLEEFIPYLQQIWQSRQLTNNGPFLRELEIALAEYLGVEFLSLFNNGTTALITALKTCGIKGEVITTPYSFVATSHSLMWNGVTPVFVDIEKHSFNLDPQKIEAAITPQTTAILPVHCYGHPCNVEQIQRIADRHDLQVIYDAAHAFGVKDAGGSVLRHGDMSVLSFHATKVFNTFEGGAIICADAATKRQIDELRNFGFVDEVTVNSCGINGKMSEINAAFGLLQLRHIDAALQKRRNIDSLYRELLCSVEGIRVVAAAPNHSYFPVMVEAQFPLSRDALYYALKSHDILARRYFYPLINNLAAYQTLSSRDRHPLPVATETANQVICLPLHADLQPRDIARIVAVVRRYASTTTCIPSFPIGAY